MTTKNNKIDEGVTLEIIIKEVEQNGHVCINDYAMSENNRNYLVSKISEKYREAEGEYDLVYIESLMLKIRYAEDEYNYYLENENSEETDIKTMEEELLKLKEELQIHENELMKEYLNNTDKEFDFLSNINDISNEKMKIIQRKVDEEQIRIERLENQLLEIELEIRNYKNIVRKAINTRNKLFKEFENYFNFSYIRTSKSKFYFYNEKYKIIFLEGTDKLQKELKSIRLNNNIEHNVVTFESIKKMKKYQQALFNIKHKPIKEELTQTELSKMSSIIEKFITWENSKELEENCERWISFYRGHSNSNYSLKPSINREKNYKKNEHLMYREIQINNLSEIQNSNEILEKLTSMQHYSLPTRLLDITSSILTALYFAVENDLEKDGELIAYKVNERNVKYFDSDSVEIQSALVLLTYEDKEEIFKLALKESVTMMLDIIQKCSTEDEYKEIKKRCITKFNKERIINRLSHEIQKNSGHLLNDIYPLDLLTSYFVKPKQNNIRIIKQQGAFIINGLIDSTECNNRNRIIKSIKPLKTNLKLEQNYKEAHKLWCEFFSSINSPFNNSVQKIIKYIIPSYAKVEFKYWLEDLNIDESAIYPDFEKIAGYLKGKYM